MLFDLYDIPKEKEYEHWVKRVHFVAHVLNYDYFKLWDLTEVEFKILEDLANEEIDQRKNKIEEAKNNK